MFTPGAEMSGLRRLLPSMVTGPRLLKLAITLLESVAPTVTELSYSEGGSEILEHDGPEFPAATAGENPAPRPPATPPNNGLAAPPSLGGHPQELLIESGALVGSPWLELPPTG